MSAKSKAKPSLLPGRKPSTVDLDSILDQALDDFETQDLNKKAAAMQLGSDAEGGAEALLRREKYQNSLKIEELMKGMHDPQFGATLHTTLSALSGQVEGQSTVDDLFRDIDRNFEKPHQVPNFVPGGPMMDQGVQGSERAIVETLSMITRAQDDMHGFEAGKMEEAGERMMEDMISQFEALGDKEDYNEVIDGVMRQLLSRDLMYEPMRNICEKFPEWLALHKINLTEADYNNYGKQYQTFQKLLAVYDMEPDNFPRLMELMFDLQEHGQPPADIIKDLAPGLKFDENGMPVMPVMPMPADGTGGFPNLNETAQQMAAGQCCLM